MPYKFISFHIHLQTAIKQSTTLVQTVCISLTSEGVVDSPEVEERLRYCGSGVHLRACLQSFYIVRQWGDLHLDDYVGFRHIYNVQQHFIVERLDIFNVCLFCAPSELTSIRPYWS